MKKLYNKMLSEQKDTSPEFEKTFRNYFRKMLVKIPDEIDYKVKYERLVEGIKAVHYSLEEYIKDDALNSLNDLKIFSHRNRIEHKTAVLRSIISNYSEEVLKCPYSAK